jgi:hypothetical protein
VTDAATPEQSQKSACVPGPIAEFEEEVAPLHIACCCRFSRRLTAVQRRLTAKNAKSAEGVREENFLRSFASFASLAVKILCEPRPVAKAHP